MSSLKVACAFMILLTIPMVQLGCPAGGEGDGDEEGSGEGATEGATEGEEGSGEGETEGANGQPLALDEVRFWGYQIQDIDNVAGDGVAKLVASHYDMLVIEPTRTDWCLECTDEQGALEEGSMDFDTAAMVRQLKASKASDGVHRKLVIAYIDIGQAEDWRWYWDPTVWPRECAAPPRQCDLDSDPSVDPFPGGWPSWIVGRDPDGWAGNYPVAFWDSGWKDIVIYGVGEGPGRNYDSIINEVLEAGFDGIYLDWVEAFEDTRVIEAAPEGMDVAGEMVSFIGEMRRYAREQAANANPNFLVIQQNAASLIHGGDNHGHTHLELLEVVDAIAQEGIWREGGADVDWEKCEGFDAEVQDCMNGPDEGGYQYYLDLYKDGGVTVFSCEYAHEYASEAYQLAEAKGYTAYCTHRSLERLTDTPPPGYPGPTGDVPDYGCADSIWSCDPRAAK